MSLTASCTDLNKPAHLLCPQTTHSLTDKEVAPPWPFKDAADAVRAYVCVCETATGYFRQHLISEVAKVLREVAYVVSKQGQLKIQCDMFYDVCRY